MAQGPVPTPMHTKHHGAAPNSAMNCWLVRRQTQQSCDEYVARFESTALMIWDYMQHELLLSCPTPVRMMLVWRPAGGQERTLASIDINGGT